MRLIRRRTKAAHPSDVLESISILLAECRNPSTQKNIIACAADTLRKTLPADSLLLIAYPAVKGMVEILFSQGKWAGLTPDSIQPCEDWQEAEAAERIHDALLRIENPLLGIWHTPLHFRSQVIGSLWLGWKSARRQDFSLEERRIAEVIAGILGAGLSQSRLAARQEDLQTQLQSMRSVERAITSSMDLNVTLNVFLDHVTEQLHADAASVLLLDAHNRDLAAIASRGFQKMNNRPPSRIRSEHSLATQATLERATVSLEGLTPGDPALGNQTLMKEEGFASYYATPLIAHGQVRGVLEVFQRTPAVRDAVWVERMETLAVQAAIAIDSTESFQNLQRARAQLAMACDSMIESFSRAVDLRARDAEGHSVRVSELSVRIAEKLGLSQDQIPALRRGALLHDVGKIGIPDRILWKPASLSEEEWQLMRQHPKFAEEVLAPIEFLRPAMDIPKFHHERWDGKGYPYGLSGTDIPLPARIFAVVDVWDSMQARRPFRGPFSASETEEYLNQASGRQFDPEVVATFLDIVRETET